MPRFLFFSLLASILLPAGVAQRASVQQLEQLLAADASQSGAKAGGMDLLAQVMREDDLAPRLSALELTERLTPPTRARLVKTYKLGPLSQDALAMLADRSALLDPPQAEIPSLPPPDIAMQRAMVRGAGDFVFQTLAHLPNFFATRSTTHFDDGPITVNGRVLVASENLRMTGKSSREITFRDGRELISPLTQATEKERLRDDGMETQGEFGPEPGIVFLDIAHGSLAFHHWETTALGRVAVFRYAVPAEASHYQVKTNCRVTQKFQKQPAYHGSITLDPATGVLLRLTLEADSSRNDPISQVGSVIEYGSVELGKNSYTCPIRSLAFSVQESDACTHDARDRRLGRPVAFMNLTRFTAYHRLGSESQIVPAPVAQTSSHEPQKTNSSPDLPHP